MKKKVLAVFAASMSLLLAAVLVSSAAAARDPFIGRWHATDALDGSNETMSIGGGPGGTVMMRLHDDYTTACGDPFPPSFVTGFLTEQDATHLSGDVQILCLAKPPFIASGGPYGAVYVYRPGDDTLLDGFGTVWYRMPTPIP